MFCFVMFSFLSFFFFFFFREKFEFSILNDYKFIFSIFFFFFLLFPLIKFRVKFDLHGIA